MELPFTLAGKKESCRDEFQMGNAKWEMNSVAAALKFRVFSRQLGSCRGDEPLSLLR